MEGEVLRDDRWGLLREFVPGGRKGNRRPRNDGRRFVGGAICPEWFWPYQTAKRRYYRRVADHPGS